MTKQKHLILIECGTTMSTNVNTGIQRVVRNILKEIEQVANERDVDFCLVKFEGADFVEYKDGALIRRRPSKQQQVLHFLNLTARYMLNEKMYHLVKSIVKCFPHQLTKEKTSNLHRFSGNNRTKNSGDTSYRSTLLLLDSTWNTDMWKSVSKFRAEGGHVCAVLYDLIPFTHPETVIEGTRIAHTRWWAQAPTYIDSVLCISKAVREEFLVWQKSNRFTRMLPEGRVGYFYLGAELNKKDPFIQVLSLRTPVYLVVGSLEPRKNHDFILDAFEEIWLQGCKANLAIVGAYGWKSETLLDRITGHPEFGSRLFLIRDASDRDLASLYDKCDALLIASLAEGFGLPVVEALERGTKVICSDIPVFREVAGDHAVYFDLASPSALALAISENVDFIEKQSIPRPSNKIKSISWTSSTHHLLESLFTCIDNRRISKNKYKNSEKSIES